MRSRVWRLLSVSFALVLLLAACGSTPAGPGTGSSGNKPSVVIQSPANGAAVPAGQAVAITGTATDTVGIDHVALFVDGVSVASTPSSTPAASVPFSLNWLPTVAGSHELKVIAYRADGTTSDPTIVTVVVGAGGSLVPGASGVALPSLSVPTLPPPPKGTKKPKPPKSSAPATSEPSTTATEPPSSEPSSEPSVLPSPSTSPLPTAAADGTAPDDSLAEAHQIVLIPGNTACPPDVFGAPAAATGCIWEQISGPSGDTTDQLYIEPVVANTSYRFWMSSCSDTSNVTQWQQQYQQTAMAVHCPDPVTHVGGWSNIDSGPTPPSAFAFLVSFGDTPPAAQTYNLYQFVVYQCQFANCNTQ